VAHVLGEDVTVLALTDRGLESQLLYAAIQEAGFHPLMRLKQASAQFRPRGWKRFYPLRDLARLGRFSAEGELYKTTPLSCHLLIRHDPGHADAWILATDLESAEPGWYALRCWVEQGYKDLKSGGFHWERTRMTDPSRVERLWLALALALLWQLEVGAAVESLELGSVAPPPSRHHSLTARGRLVILAALIAGHVTLSSNLTIFDPPSLPDDPWPPDLPMPPPITEQEFQERQKTYT
jgi:hypothetical protein